MELGSRSESVTMEAGASAGDSKSGAISTVIYCTFVEYRSLSGRRFQTLLPLTPKGVATTTPFGDQG